VFHLVLVGLHSTDRQGDADSKGQRDCTNPFHHKSPLKISKAR
jgi:hypothetical protein